MRMNSFHAIRRDAWFRRVTISLMGMRLGMGAFLENPMFLFVDDAEPIPPIFQSTEYGGAGRIVELADVGCDTETTFPIRFPRGASNRRRGGAESLWSTRRIAKWRNDRPNEFARRAMNVNNNEVSEHNRGSRSQHFKYLPINRRSEMGIISEGKHGKTITMTYLIWIMTIHIRKIPTTISSYRETISPSKKIITILNSLISKMQSRVLMGDVFRSMSTWEISSLHLHKIFAYPKERIFLHDGPPRATREISVKFAISMIDLASARNGWRFFRERTETSIARRVRFLKIGKYKKLEMISKWKNFYRFLFIQSSTFCRIRENSRDDDAPQTR